MNGLSRREFVRQAASFGAALMLVTRGAQASSVNWQERRDLFPQGVASGDPAPDSIILWTRRPPMDKAAAKLTVELAEDSDLIRSLTEPNDTDGDIRYVNFASKSDVLAIPYTNNHLYGTGDITKLIRAILQKPSPPRGEGRVRGRAANKTPPLENPAKPTLSKSKRTVCKSGSRQIKARRGRRVLRQLPTTNHRQLTTNNGPLTTNPPPTSSPPRSPPATPRRRCPTPRDLP